MEAVNLSVATREIRGRGELGELRGQELEVMVDVGFEVKDRLSGEYVSNGLALAGVLGAVASVKEASLEGDEAIVVLAVTLQSAGILGCWQVQENTS
jgi:hypothetical protein